MRFPNRAGWRHSSKPHSRSPSRRGLAGVDCSRPFGELPTGVPAVGSLLLFPLAGPGRLRGALYLARSPGQPAFGPDDEEAVLPISICLQEGNLVEEASLQAQLRLLNRVAQAAAGNLEMAAIFEASLRELDRHLPMCVSAVWLAEADAPLSDEGVDQDRQKTGTAENDGPPKLAGSHSAVSDAAVWLRLAAASTGQGTRAGELGLIPETRLPLAHTPFAPCWQDTEGGVYTNWQATEAAPAKVTAETSGAELTGQVSYPCFATLLRAGNRIVGILQSVCSRPTGFKSEQVQLLYLVADLLGPAISNCQLFDRLRVTYEELRTTQAQLIRNEKLRALGELASGVAHDFNNSLCGVVGFLEITMMDKLLSSSNRANLELARTCALDAAKTVHRIQDFARARPKDAVFLPLDLSELVRETVELTRPKWENLDRSRAQRIVLQMNVVSAGSILGNAAELREVLTNLVFNAVDAMPQGGTLTVRTWSRDEAVWVSVGDTGIGMLPAVQQRLFEPFFTTKGERGNGMGLSVAFGIVKHHGGDITVASEVGRGSTFTIRLPAASPKHARSPGDKAGKVQAVASGDPAFPSLRVLVVEDEDAVRQFLASVLAKLGHQPRLTCNGNEAMQAFAEESFDVVVTDMGLPGINGQEVARRIAERAPGMPIVLLTGWADQLKSEAKPLPCITRILGKPVTTQELAATLQAVCPR